MPFFADRRRRAGRHLEWKVGLFTVAAVLGLVGISLEERWMTGGAIAVLLGAMLLRFLPGAQAGPGEDEGDGAFDEERVEEEDQER